MKKRIPRNSSLRTKLELRTEITANGCHEYTGSHDAKGYGSLSHKCKHYRAHRAAYLVYKGVIPRGDHVLHKCDNPPCINPDHLFLGTNADNMRDMKNKNRQCKGSDKHNSFLTEKQVVAIREEYAQGNITHQELADTYGFSDRGAISSIVTGKKYPHLGGTITKNDRPLVTPTLVRHIRERAKSTSASAISREIGLCISAVCRIINRETWRHVG